MNIRASGWDGRYILIDKVTGTPVLIGEWATDFRGKAAIVCGGQAPASSASSGRVEIAVGDGGPNMSYYPSVYGLEWKRI